MRLPFARSVFRTRPSSVCRRTCRLRSCKAGKEAGAYGREIESSQDSEKLAAMEEKGWLETHHEFADRAMLLELAEPVKKAYAEELGATDVLDAVNAVQVAEPG